MALKPITETQGRSFTGRLLTVANVILFVMFSAAAFICSILASSELTRSAAARATALTDLIAVTASGAMSSADSAELERYAQSASKESVIDSVVFYDAQGKALTSGGSAKKDVGDQEITRTITGKDGRVLGQVKVVQDLSEVEGQMKIMNIGLVGIVATLLAVLSALLWWVSKSISRQVGVAVSELASVRDVLTGTAESLAINSQEVSEKVTEQGAAVSETVAAMAEMSGMMAQSNEKFAEVEKMANNVGEQTREGRAIMSEMESWVESIQEANGRLQNIDSIIDEISTKARVINDIVFKTQLLSFNASIEAARAGVHGRGFAVVAEEVGNLAQTSGDAASEIATLLESSRSQVRSILDTVGNRVIEGRRVANNAVEKFNEISGEVSNISMQVKVVRDATREQDIGIRQVREAMGQIDVATQGISNLAHKSNDSSRSLDEQVKLVHHYIGALGKLLDGGAEWDAHAGAGAVRASPTPVASSNRNPGRATSAPKLTSVKTGRLSDDFEKWMNETGS